MLVRRVQEFINALVSIKDKLSEDDLALLDAFQERYSAKVKPLEDITGELPPLLALAKVESLEDITGELPPLLTPATVESVEKITGDLPPPLYPHSVLSDDELVWIRERFAERWKNVADTEKDYTFWPGDVNTPWVAFAKDVATELKLPYLLLLIPILKNQVDPDKLSRLDQAPDPRAIFISNDGVWHRVIGLLEHLQHPKAQFSTYDFAKQHKPRALTLNEIYRLRGKRGEDLIFRLPGNDNYYSTFWDYVLREEAPTWQRRGDCPTHLLPNLLEIIEDYYDAAGSDKKDFRKFRQHIKVFANALASCSLEDVNSLYGISIDLGDKKRCYLVEILLDCMQNTEDLHDKLAAVAKWLCQFDPTLVSKQKKIESVYKPLKVGKYFDVAKLRELVLALELGENNTLKLEVAKLLKQLEGVDKIEPESELIEQIRKIYALRWKCVIDTVNDYTRRQDKPNQSWICLARHLASAGHLHPDSNYYRLLIPTLKLDNDPVTQEPFTIYPLSHLILSDNGTKLIFGQHLIDHHKANGTFYQCSEHPPCPLTQKELARLRYAAPRYYDYYSRVVATEADPAISIKTVEAIRELVNGTLNPAGLLLGRDITETQADIAEKAYAKFLAFIAGLPEDGVELNRLNRQKILFRTKQLSFAAIMAEVQKQDADERGCIAVFGQYLLKLVLDYNPQAEFRKDIEKDDQVLDINSIRRVSARKVYREYDELTQQEATRRSLIIFVSLMTHGFSYLPFTGTSLRAWDTLNNVPDYNCVDLFNTLFSFIETGDLKQSRFTYVSLMENIVKKAAAANDFLTSWTRYSDTLQWWKSIGDQSIFAKENNTCFEPEQLFTVIWSLRSKKQFKSRMLIENFLEQVMQTSLQPKNPQLQWVRINIEFNKLLSNENLPTDDRKKILEELRKDSAPVPADQYLKASREFLIHRLASCGARTGCKNKIGLFGASPGAFTSFYTELTVLLKGETLAQSVKSMVGVLQDKIQKLTINKLQSDNMLEYLQTLGKPITAQMSSERRVTVEDELQVVTELAVLA